MFTLNDLFDIAAKMEENGERIYLGAMEKSGTKSLRELLQWMAEEEACHRRWFLRQKVPSLDGGEDLEAMIPDIIREMMGVKSLSLDEVDFSTIETEVQLLNTFAGFEKDTILFYEFLDPFIESETAREALKQIIREEARHVEQLDQMIRSLKGG